MSSTTSGSLEGNEERRENPIKLWGKFSPVLSVWEVSDRMPFQFLRFSERQRLEERRGEEGNTEKNWRKQTVIHLSGEQWVGQIWV